MIFVVNSGSSSLKFKVYDSKTLAEKFGGIVERIGLDAPFLKIAAGKKEKKIEFPEGLPNHEEALRRVFAALAEAGCATASVTAVGHRVVHGGEEFTEPTVIDAKNLKKLRAYNALAPLHNPPNLLGIDSCRVLLKNVPNVAVFDTAFYKTIPDYAFMYALPWEYYEKHRIRKYGFHGISHRYVTEQAAKTLKKPYGKLRFVSCHLGSGASVTAVNRGKAVDTSMGFTPLEGLTMSTRCGDIDPAIPLHLMRKFGMSVDEVDETLNKKSGLLGVSGHKDMRDVMAAAEKGNYRAKLAIDMFCYDVARYVGAYASIMGGVDAVIFTAGVGERSPEIRKRVMSMVTIGGKKPKALVVPTNEELMIARETKVALKMR